MLIEDERFFPLYFPSCFSNVSSPWSLYVHCLRSPLEPSLKFYAPLHRGLGSSLYLSPSSVHAISNFRSIFNKIKYPKNTNNNRISIRSKIKERKEFPTLDIEHRFTGRRRGGRKSSTRRKNRSGFSFRRVFVSTPPPSPLSLGGYCFPGGNKNNQAAIVKTDRFESNRSERDHSSPGFRWRVFAIVREA